MKYFVGKSLKIVITRLPQFHHHFVSLSSSHLMSSSLCSESTRTSSSFVCGTSAQSLLLLSTVSFPGVVTDNADNSLRHCCKSLKLQKADLYIQIHVCVIKCVINVHNTYIYIYIRDLFKQFWFLVDGAKNLI